MTTTAPPALAASPREVAPPVSPRVVAVLVLDPSSTEAPDTPGALDVLEETLDSLAGQSRPPDVLLVLVRGVGSRSATPMLELVRSHTRLHDAIPAVELVDDAATAPAPARESDVEAWNRALPLVPAGKPAAAGEEQQEWLWLLRTDTAPLTTALDGLLRAALQSSAVGMVGPKLVHWRDPRRLVEMGWQVTRAGRRVDAPTWGEPDQGQYDHRSDVIAVAAGGMLVRAEVLRELDGFDSSFGDVAADLDLGWRAQLCGHRVVVAPSARVRDGSLSGPDAEIPAVADPDGPRQARQAVAPPRGLLARRAGERRAARRVALTRCAAWTVPFLAVWVAVSSVASAALLLVLKRPAHAWVALGDLTSLVHPWSGTASRWRFRRRTTIRRSHLAPVFVGSGDAAALTWDRVQDAVTLERDRRRHRTAPVTEAPETGPVAEEAEDLTLLPASLPQRIATHPGAIVVLLSVVLTGVLFRGPLGAGLLDGHGAGLAGGELRAFSTDADGLWHLFRDAWHGAGLGGTAVVSPGVAVLAALTSVVEALPGVAGGRSPASVTVAWLLLAAVPLSTFTAYVGGRVATLARWPRALVALAWGSSAVLTAALGQGRLPVALAHILLPLVLAGFAAACTRRTTWTSTFATALATGLLAAFVPTLGAVAVAAALGVVLLAPGMVARLRGLVLAVVPVALLGPWVLDAFHSPLLLLSGEGTIDVASASTSPWQMALGLPAEVGLRRALLLVPLLALAVLGLARRSRADGRSAALTALGVVAVLGLAIGLVSPHVVVGSAPDDDGVLTSATLWSGVGLDLYVVAALAVVLVGWQGVLRAVGESRWGARRLVISTAAVVVALTVAGSASLAGRDALQGGVAVGVDALPAVAVDQARGPDATRLLVIEPPADDSGSGTVGYRLVGAEPGGLLRDVGTPVSADPLVSAVVASIASTSLVDVTGPGLGSQLADLGIGFVSLRADSTSALARTLDAGAGLVRLGTTGDQTLWRVLPRTAAGASSSSEPIPVSRVRLVTSAGLVAAVPVTGPHAALDTSLPAGTGRRLVVAESPAWAATARVTYDGRPLTLDQTATTSGQPTYDVPDGAGRLVVDLPPTHEQWFLVQLALVVVVLFLAVPFGTRRSRRLS